MTATVTALQPDRAPQRAARPGSRQHDAPHERADATGLGLAALSGVAYAWVSFQLILAVILGVARLTSNADSYSISNGSMEPNLPVGAVIINSAVDPDGVVPAEDLPDVSNLPPGSEDIGELSLGNIRLFDVISFDDPANPGQVITHRVVRIANGTFVTKGDANIDPDSTPVTFDNITGKGRLAVPFVGMPSVWVQDGNYLRLVLWGGALLAAGTVIAVERERVRRHAKAATVRAAASTPNKRHAPTTLIDLSDPSSIKDAADRVELAEWPRPNPDIAPVTLRTPATPNAWAAGAADRGHADEAADANDANHAFGDPETDTGAANPSPRVYHADLTTPPQPPTSRFGWGVTVPIVVTMPNSTEHDGESPTTVPILITLPHTASVATYDPVTTQVPEPPSPSEEWVSFPGGWGSDLTPPPPELP